MQGVWNLPHKLFLNYILFCLIFRNGLTRRTFFEKRKFWKVAEFMSRKIFLEQQNFEGRNLKNWQKKSKICHQRKNAFLSKLHYFTADNLTIWTEKYPTMVQRYWKRLFIPGSVSVSKIKRQWCKVIPKRVPDILKSVIFVSGYPKCRLFFVLPEKNRLGTIGNEI